MKMKESSFLHANPEVHKMVQMFNDGELNHSVATCLTCHETRPQFYATKPSEKFHTENRKPQSIKLVKGAINNILQIKTSLITYLPFQVILVLINFACKLRIRFATLFKKH